MFWDGSELTDWPRDWQDLRYMAFIINHHQRRKTHLITPNGSHRQLLNLQGAAMSILLVYMLHGYYKWPKQSQMGISDRLNVSHDQPRWGYDATIKLEINKPKITITQRYSTLCLATIWQTGTLEISVIADIPSVSIGSRCWLEAAFNILLKIGGGGNNQSTFSGWILLLKNER
jgi:hypothetical protein